MMNLSPQFSEELSRAAQNNERYINLEAIFLSYLDNYNGPGIYATTVKLLRLLHFYIGESFQTDKRLTNHLGRFRDDGLRGNKVNTLVAESWRQEPNRNKHDGWQLFRLPSDIPDPVIFFIESTTIRLTGATDESQGGQNRRTLDLALGKESRIDDLTVLAVYNSALAREKEEVLPRKGSGAWASFGDFRNVDGSPLTSTQISKIVSKRSYPRVTGHLPDVAQYIKTLPAEERWANPDRAPRIRDWFEPVDVSTVNVVQTLALHKARDGSRSKRVR
ncbi:hypothetical protein B0H13DRAFT_2034826 [Mycena leptocephala]|nr:hypothetical protein B0H13DRAFT_2034826 [Mycena leptocephala]